MLVRVFDRLEIEAQREEARRRLRESEERFRDLVEGSIQGILGQRDDRPLFVNPSFARMYGFDNPGEVEARAWGGELVGGGGGEGGGRVEETPAPSADDCRR